MPESLAVATRFLLTGLGPSSKENIHMIVCKASEWLKCNSAAYGCIEAASGELRFRSAHGLPPRSSRVREAARLICSEIIAGNKAATAFKTRPRQESAILEDCKPAQAGFKSFLGCPVAVDRQTAGALVAFHAKKRKFSAKDRELIAMLAGLLAIEDTRYQREEALSRRIALEKMLKDLSTRAIASEDASAFIEHSLAMLGSRMKAGGSFLWEFDPRKKTICNTYEWLSEGHAPRKADLQNIPVDALPWGVGRLMKGEIVKINDARSIQSTAERELLEQIGVRACLVIPLFRNDAFFGFIGLECYRGPKLWVSDDILVLQTAAEIMMRCIENRLLTEKLIATRKNLEKTVAGKTLALRAANERLTTEIAAHKKTITNLKQREAQLAEKNQSLMDLTNSLAGLLNKNKEDLAEAEQCVVSNLNKLIDPGAINAGEKGLNGVQQEYIENLKGGFKELSSLLKTRSSFVYQCLTPMEIQVANLIKQGKGNKQIADLLNLSHRTIEVHRYNIRKKLQMDKTKMNLKTYLLTME